MADSAIQPADLSTVATTGDHTDLTNIGTNTHTQIDTHISSTSNPHSVTIDQVTPTTTKGDIIVENGTNAVRLGVGTNNQLLSADSTELAGVKWIDPPASSPLTTKGDLYTYDTDNQRLGVGSNNQLLSADSTEPTGLKWIDPPASSPLTTKGDIYTYGTDNARLPVGTDGQYLKADSTQSTGLNWDTLTASDVTDFDTDVDAKIPGIEFAGNNSGSGTSHVFTHNLNTNDVMVEIVDTSTLETVFAKVARTSVNAVTVTTASSISAGAIRALITKIG